MQKRLSRWIGGDEEERYITESMSLKEARISSEFRDRGLREQMATKVAIPRFKECRYIHIEFAFIHVKYIHIRMFLLSKKTRYTLPRNDNSAVDTSPLAGTQLSRED